MPRDIVQDRDTGDLGIVSLLKRWGDGQSRSSIDGPSVAVDDTDLLGRLADTSLVGRMRNEIVRLLMEHRSTLFAFIYASVRDYDIAEEVLQDVSVVICEDSDSFELGTNFGAWAREIARRRILAYYRSSKRFPDPLSDEELRNLQAGFDAVDDVSVKQRMASLVKCLESLKPFAKRLVQLRYASRCSLCEISRQVGRQPESVRKALYRTRQSLRECIERRLRRGDEIV